MSRIDDLIAEHCPDGVEFVPLGEVAINFDRLRRPITKSKRILGKYPYYGANGIQDYVNEYIFDGSYLLMGEDGSVIDSDGHPVLNWVEGRFWANNHAHILQSKDGKYNLKFLYYYLGSVDVSSFVTGGTQPKINQKNMNRIPVPLVPISLQNEIVVILDKFTQLEAELEVELEAELEARRRQYQHYRDELLTFARRGGVRLLGDIAYIYGGLVGKTKSDFENGDARFVPYVNVFANPGVNLDQLANVFVSRDEKQNRIAMGDVLLTSSSENLDEVAMSSVVLKNPEFDVYLNSFCFGVRFEDGELFDPSFLKHLFRSKAMRKQLVRTASGVTRFNVSKARVKKIQIPIPDLQFQREVAEVLDRLEALVSDISIGLPAELQARRRQYEYYRYKLLTFKEKA